ncbi:MAG: energy transducer TonB [Candidatus Rokubacteria bacterium]|nr:energy transducer TonB [Candidatus Rokubacteria bacterium]
MLTLGVAALAGGAGFALDALAGRLGIAGLLFQALVLKSTLALRGLAEAATCVAGAVSLVGSSSHRVLDEAALEAVRGVGPAPFPPDLAARPLRVRLPVVFELR